MSVNTAKDLIEDLYTKTISLDSLIPQGAP